MSSENTAGKAVRAASAIRNIVKGAAAGGVYGAAAGAVKSFLPELIKAAVTIIAIALLLPTLIFAALPNIFFGYDNIFADDIVKLTDKAYSIDAAYKKVKDYTQEVVDSIVDESKNSHTSEDGEQGYDEVEVNTDTENTNIYWFIAINSVAHQQDLYTMSEQSIKDMIIKKIVSAVSVVTDIVGEGDDELTIRTLKIDIKDLDPDELMDKLEFDDDERNWATVLYNSMAEEQIAGTGSSADSGNYTVNYGNIVFADAVTPCVYYNQFDSRWGSLPYGRTGTIARSSCGPTSLAMVVATFKDSSITPVEVVQFAVDNGYRCEGNGSYHSLIPEGGEHYGLTVEAIGRDAEKLVEALKSGKLVIAIMSAGHFTSGGHFLVLRGVTADGKILVADSGSYARSNQEWDLRIILNEASRNAGSGGPFWVLSP